MKSRTSLRGLRLTALCALAAIPFTTLCPGADHRDAPGIAQDGALDINDLYVFMDPNNNGTDDKVIFIVTFHGFIVPGEAGNEAWGDPNARFRFDIFTNHVNAAPPTDLSTKKEVAKYRASIKPKRSIDVTFGPRTGGADPNAAAGKEALEIPSQQDAFLQFTGFTGINKRDKFAVPVLIPNLGTAEQSLVGQVPFNPKNAANIPVDIEAYVGEADDPFFFDIPGFSSFIQSIRTTGSPNLDALKRGRDTFAGYNTMAIALSIPVDALVDSVAGPKIGVQVLGQRKTELVKATGKVGSGTFKTLDSMGNPAVNVVLIPFTRKNAYNSATPKDVASGKFVGNDSDERTPLGVVDTLLALGTDQDHIVALAGLAVTPGDMLVLDTTVDNMGPGGGNIAGAGFATAGGGRRLRDDVVDTFLFVATNEAYSAGDNVPANDKTFGDSFPFLAPPHQPRNPAVPPGPDVNPSLVNDSTQN